MTISFVDLFGRYDISKKLFLAKTENKIPKLRAKVLNKSNISFESLQLHQRYVTERLKKIVTFGRDLKLRVCLKLHICML